MPDKYSLPSPPKISLIGGPGWAYGVGCGVGPFIGLGVAVSPSVIFGAGAAAGAFCGVGFGAGFVAALGTGFTLTGNPIPVFFTPRLDNAERAAENTFPKVTAFFGRLFATVVKFGRQKLKLSPINE